MRKHGVGEKNSASEAQHLISVYVVQENTLFQMTNFEEEKNCLFAVSYLPSQLLTFGSHQNLLH